MSLADGVAVLLVVGLTAYLVLGGADFGVGLWDLVSGAGPRGRRMRALADSSMAPVWEANHVWLIFVLVTFWTGFPEAFGAIMSTLYVPAFLAAVGIILRGTAFAVRGLPVPTRVERAVQPIFALSSILTPFFLGTLVGAIASGRVPLGNAAGDPVTSWWNPTSVMAGVLAVATGAYLAAVYLAADAVRAGDPDLVRACRRRALASGVVAGALAVAGLVVVRSDSRALYDELIGDGLALVALSAAAGVATLALVWLGRYGLARIAGALAVAAVVWGWVVAQLPDLLPGEITVEEAAAGRPTLIALLVGYAIGAVVLVPALGFLYSLVLRGRLDKPLPALEPRRDETPLP